MREKVEVGWNIHQLRMFGNRKKEHLCQSSVPLTLIATVWFVLEFSALCHSAGNAPEAQLTYKFILIDLLSALLEGPTRGAFFRLNKVVHV